MTKGQHKYSPTEEVNSNCQENMIFSCESSLKIIFILKGISIKKNLTISLRRQKFYVTEATDWKLGWKSKFSDYAYIKI